MNSLVVAKYTMRELLKSKLLWNAVGLSLFIAVISWVAAEFTFGVPARVALDVGLGALTLSGYGVAIFVGSTLITKEMESRTIYMIVSRPISRGQFLSGKILGLALFLLLNISLLGLASIGTAALLGLAPTELIWWSIVGSYFECLILMTLVICISIETNTILTILFSVLMLVAGHVVGETREALYVKMRPALASVLEFYHLVLPGFYRFNLKDYIIYEQSPPAGWILSMLSYGTCYFLFLFMLTIWLLKKKDLN